MMKITGLSHLFKWENLHNWWLTKYFFAPLYICILPFVCSRDMLQIFGKGLIGFLWKYVSNSHRMHL